MKGELLGLGMPLVWGEEPPKQNSTTQRTHHPYLISTLVCRLLLRHLRIRTLPGPV